MNKQPNWTVISNQPNGRWTSKIWEFFDDEKDADKCYKHHIEVGNGLCKRPYYPPTDYKYLATIHEEAIKEGIEAEKIMEEAFKR